MWKELFIHKIVKSSVLSGIEQPYMNRVDIKSVLFASDIFAIANHPNEMYR